MSNLETILPRLSAIASKKFYKIDPWSCSHSIFMKENDSKKKATWRRRAFCQCILSTIWWDVEFLSAHPGRLRSHLASVEVLPSHWLFVSPKPEDPALIRSTVQWMRQTEDHGWCHRNLCGSYPIDTTQVNMWYYFWHLKEFGMLPLVFVKRYLMIQVTEEINTGG